MSSTFSWTLQNLTPKRLLLLPSEAAAAWLPSTACSRLPDSASVSELGASPSVPLQRGANVTRLSPALGSVGLGLAQRGHFGDTEARPAVAHAHRPWRHGHCTPASSLLCCLPSKPWWERRQRQLWGWCPGGQGRGLAGNGCDRPVSPDRCPVFFGAPDHPSARGARAAPRGGRARRHESQAPRQSLPAPARLRPACEMHGGLNVLLIKLEARRSGSVGKRRTGNGVPSSWLPAGAGPAAGGPRGPTAPGSRPPSTPACGGRSRSPGASGHQQVGGPGGREAPRISSGHRHSPPPGSAPVRRGPSAGRLQGAGRGTGPQPRGGQGAGHPTGCTVSPWRCFWWLGVPEPPHVLD